MKTPCMSKDIPFPVSGSRRKAVTTRFCLSTSVSEDNGGNGDKTIATYSFLQLLPCKFHFMLCKDREFFVSKSFPSLTLPHTLLHQPSKERRIFPEIKLTPVRSIWTERRAEEFSPCGCHSSHLLATL